MSQVVARMQHGFFLIVCLVLLGGCSDPHRETTFGAESGEHPANWVASQQMGTEEGTRSSGNHPKAFKADPSGCEECHGADLKGGISGVSCFSSAMQCHGHPAGWADPAGHGTAVKAAPNPSRGEGLNECRGCHGEDFNGGFTKISCFPCHGAKAAHAPKPWRFSQGSARTHGTTDVGNAAACALCHKGQAPTPAPPDRSPGCFNSTLCHGPLHEPGFSDPLLHGAAAKAGLAVCQRCHSDKPSGLPGSNPRFNLNIGPLSAGCETCHQFEGVAHPVLWNGLGEDTGHQTVTAEGARTGCSLCHGGILQGVEGNAPSCTACHTAGSPLEKKNCTSCHSEIPPATGTHLKHFTPGETPAVYGSMDVTQDSADPNKPSSGYLFNCGNCHPKDRSQHANRLLDENDPEDRIADVALYDPEAPAGSLKALNCAEFDPDGNCVRPATYTKTPDDTVIPGDPGAGRLQYTQGTCDNVYCHSFTQVTTVPAAEQGGVPFPSVPPFTPPLLYPVNPKDLAQGLFPWKDVQDVYVRKTRQYMSPVWGVDSLGCNGCHEYPIITQYPWVTGGAGDSHGWVDEYGRQALHTYNHAGNSTGPLQCNICHHDTVRAFAQVLEWVLGNTRLADISIHDAAKHVNGTKDVAFTPADSMFCECDNEGRCQTCYTRNFNVKSAAYDPKTMTCSNVSCHQYQREVVWGVPYRRDSIECHVCHQGWSVQFPYN